MRYILTGGDNGYCAKCGGLCDRALLEVNDQEKTYRYIDGYGVCLGKHCWHGFFEQHYVYGNGYQLSRTINGQGTGYGNYKVILPDGTEHPLTIKHNKYGKDGEFPDKLSTYKYIGIVKMEH